MIYYEEVFIALNNEKVDYLVVGGIAMVLHGVVRFTADLDIFARLTQDNLMRLGKAMGKLGYRPKLPVKVNDFADAKKRERWVREKNIKVFSFYHPKDVTKIVDVFVEEIINFDSAKKAGLLFKAGEITIPVISKKDLIRLKSISGRPEDLLDIQKLKELDK